MKQPTFHGRVLLPLSVFAKARAGDPLAMERILRYYDGYINKLCTRTLYELDGTPHVRVDEYMKHRLQNKLIRAILKDSLSSRSVTPFPACVCVLYQRPCVHYTELCFGFVGRSLTKPAQIVDIFLSAWDFFLYVHFRAVKDRYLSRYRSASFPTHGCLWI